MEQLRDRTLLVVLVATALGGPLWWSVGFVRAEAEGIVRIVLLVLLLALYFGILAGLWFGLGSGESADDRGGRDG